MLSNCKTKYNFIDLFAGAGGLSEGFIQAGFNSVAHVEMNEFAAKTLETRNAYYYLKETNNLILYKKYISGEISRNTFMQQIPYYITESIINETMSDKTLPSIFRTIDIIMKKKNINKIDVIVGGPPCQAYSLVGRAQSSHMKLPMSEDPRNDLYIIYARFLKKYKPKMFVFENVMGIESANAGTTWKKIKKRLRQVGYIIGYSEQNAKDFGVLQNRKRMIIVGWRKDSIYSYPIFENNESTAIVKDLLDDLPSLFPSQCATTYKGPPTQYIIEKGIRTEEDILSLHKARPNIKRDIDIYIRAITLWNKNHLRLNYNDLPEELKTHKNRNSFVDRFKVVEGNDHLCHTILSHLSKDGHYFIHPDIKQHRSITVREAARIQSFPDNYFFEGPRTSQFVQVGNAVPPLMAKGIASGIATQLDKEKTQNGK